MTVLVVRGDARRLPLPDASVDLVVTSPPYFALRDYGYPGQIGSEATPAEYIAALIECTREWVRVLKPSGSIFVDLGDKYAAPSGAGPNAVARGLRNVQPSRPGDNRPKSLMLLPERYRIACVDQLGLIARAVLVWAKPNGLPESVTDRVRRSHEDWVHLVKQPRYYAAVDEIREPQQHSLARVGTANRQGTKWQEREDGGDARFRAVERTLHPLGKLPGSVWTIPSEPLKVPEHLGVDHFAAFPSEWPRRLILGWSPSGVCVACGEGRRPVVNASYFQTRGDTVAGGQKGTAPGFNHWGGVPHLSKSSTITGYACACPEPTAPTRPAVVLDPFSGTGTVMHVASALGRIGVGTDLSMDYARLAASPELRDARLRKVLGLDKPELVPAGQLELDGWSA